MRLTGFKIVVYFTALVRQSGAFPFSNFEERAASLGNLTTAGLNPAAQLIDVSAAHGFEPPNFENGDLRGPCPGLNAMANHKFIPHDNVVPFNEALLQSSKSMHYRSRSPS